MTYNEEREEAIRDAVVDVVTEALFDPIDYFSVVETVGYDYEEYAEDEDFINSVYNRAGAEMKRIFQEFSGT